MRNFLSHLWNLGALIFTGIFLLFFGWLFMAYVGMGGLNALFSLETWKNTISNSPGSIGTFLVFPLLFISSLIAFIKILRRTVTSIKDSDAEQESIIPPVEMTPVIKIGLVVFGIFTLLAIVASILGY